MEPKKLFTSIGVTVTTVVTIILFFVEYQKLENFFFPERAIVGIPLFLISVFSVALLVFYIVYSFYFNEKLAHQKTKVELDNVRRLLHDSEQLRLLDFVTGIPNEQKFEIDFNNRSKELYHLILIDLDGFGQINKKQGFQIGDQVIRLIAQDLFKKMRRDEEMYKRSYRLETGFFKRVYRKYTGGDEFIFLIKGEQYEAVGFAVRIQNQLSELSNKLKSLGYEYVIDFHAAIVPVHPNDTYSQSLDNLQRAFVQAAENHQGLRVFWDKFEEVRFKKPFSFIYEKAYSVFKA